MKYHCVSYDDDSDGKRRGNRSIIIVMDWMFVLPSNPYIAALTCNVMIFRGGTFGSN